MVDKKKHPEHCGFEGPAIGEAVPKDWVRVTRKNGTITYVPPDKAPKKRTEEKTKGRGI